MILDKIKPVSVPYGELSVGRQAGFRAKLSLAETTAFSHATGDINPLHNDVSFSRTTRFSSIICHGMQVASFFSTLSGVLLPGLGSLTISQQVEFHHPVMPGQVFYVRGEVAALFEAQYIIELALQVESEDGKKLVSGVKLVKAREGVIVS